VSLRAQEGVPGPLNGVRVLDLTHVWAGPLAVRFLADLGAEVVKVEAPYGRGPREFPSAPIGGWLGGEPGDEPWNANAIFTKLHRNRRSLCIDLKQDAGLETLLKLVTVADIIIENFSARAMPAMGLSYDVLQQANPNIIYVSMPGYGASGPYRDRVAFGPTVEPMSGLTTMLGYGADAPRNSAMALMDPIAATHAAAVVTTALRRRARDGHGSHVEMSLHEGGVAYSGPWLIDTQLGHKPACIGNRHPNMAPHGIYACAGNDQWLALACEDDAQWQALCSVVKTLDASLSYAGRVGQIDLLDTLISAWSADKSKATAADILQQAGVPAGPVNNTPDMLADEHVQSRGFFVPYEQFETPMPGNPIHMDGLDSEQWTRCPRLGADNTEVLADWLDFDDEQIAGLVQNEVLMDRPPG
jgi:crotonobetainyl-CoA:carnitine CoA-transferase CaiB-like acyl-CoA transferase